MIPSQTIMHPALGKVKIHTRSNAVKFRASWHDGYVQLNGPSHATVDEYMRALDELTPKLLAARPQELSVTYHDGFSFATDDWTFSLVCSSAVPRGHVVAQRMKHPSLEVYEVRVASDTDFASPATREAIASIIKKMAVVTARRFLIPQAVEVARSLGLEGRVSNWEVGRGKRRLGLCDAGGRISLSATLMFLPRDLRRSTITHELAHLTHFDHSPAFYALWDSYLGHSHKLDRERLRTIPIPLPK